MSNVDDIIQVMQSRFNASASQGLDLVYQFNISDADDYYLAVKDGQCNLAVGQANNPDCTLIMDKATMKGIISGETSGMSAFMSGRLRAEGDMMLAMKLGELFPS